MDIVGRRFGRLVAVRIVEKYLGNHWLMQCDCGRYAVRRYADLSSRRRSFACSECVQLLRVGRRVPGWAWREIFDATGSLWPVYYDDRLIEQILDNCERRIGVRPGGESPKTASSQCGEPSLEQSFPPELDGKELGALEAEAFSRFRALEFSHLAEFVRLRNHAEKMMEAVSA